VDTVKSILLLIVPLIVIIGWMKLKTAMRKQLNQNVFSRGQHQRANDEIPRETSFVVAGPLAEARAAIKQA